MGVHASMPFDLFGVLGVIGLGFGGEGDLALMLTSHNRPYTEPNTQLAY